LANLVEVVEMSNNLNTRPTPGKVAKKPIWVTRVIAGVGATAGHV